MDIFFSTVKMDLFVAGLGLVGTVLCGIIIYFLSVYWGKEKTYDEAIAEQRKIPNDARLISRAKENKDKKDKKRPQKKVKEKKEKVRQEILVDEPKKNVIVNKVDTAVPEPIHVNFVEPEVVAVVDISVPSKTQKKRKKSEVKPILVNKNEEPVVAKPTLVECAPLNSFDKISPKDELSLRKSNKSDTNNKPPETEKVKPKNEVPEKKKDKQASIKSKVELSDAPASSGNNSPLAQPKNQIKEVKKKSKKNDVPTIQQITPDTVNLQLMVNLIRQASLTRDEVQTLTDLLLNKQLDDRLDPSEWIEGRQDPVVKLKKQLAEKEDALANETASSQALQTKLKELRVELNGERAKMQQTCRQYEEAILVKQGEIQALHQRSNAMTMQFDSEKQNFTQKIQQLQTQCAEDQIMIRKLQEEMGQAQGAYQQELNQRKQLEVHLTRQQETENALKNQIQQVNLSYNNEMKKSHHLDDEIMQLQSKLKGLMESSGHQQELARQLEDLSRIKQDLELKLSESRRIIDDLKFEKNRLQADVQTLTNQMTNYLQADWESRAKVAEIRVAECDAAIKLNEKEIKKLIARLSEMEANTEKVCSERDRFRNDSSDLFKKVEELQIALAKVRAEEADRHENGDASAKDPNAAFINNEATLHQVEAVSEQLREELRNKENVISKLTVELQGKKTELSNISAELAKQKTDLTQLTTELEAQKTKNNELRQKNWKAVDALSNTEKELNSKIKEATEATNNKASAVRQEEQQNTKKILERLFPDVSCSDENHSKWLTNFETQAKSKLSDLRNAPVSSDSPAKIADLEKQKFQLEGLVTHYKSIIVETEGMLRKLQQHVEKEEIRWNEQLAKKQAELEAAKQNNSATNEFQSTISTLESSLEKLKQQRDSELATLKSEMDVIRNQNAEYSDNFTLKCKEVETITNTLRAESERNKDLNKEIVKLRSNLKIGQDSFEAEKKVRLELEDKLKVLSCTSTTDSHENSIPVTLPRSIETPNENPVKKKNKKRKNGSEGSAA